ncbi:MAG: hypothetical protein BWX88_01676 [Planctomycetes bacterium ADurb.Bin126]|nr:MAG: hypothetical protein BWX88_01676 [Planctomycetes bacterium ADurb.Bin126]HOD83453.1 MerR family transcriptional regulator [Phycisphaerae bacterium]HQL73206.1 MerR family transcriptional regulator [Phycisphaerae bacterium]
MKTSIRIAEEAFNSRQASEIVGVTRRKIVHWDKRGLVKPSVCPAQGRGSRRLFSYVDLLALKTVQTLREEGLSLQKIRKCVRYLRRHLPDVSQPLTCCSLIAAGETIYLVEDEKTLIDTVRNQGQRAFLQISIADIDRELRQKVLQISTSRVEEVTVGEETYQVEVTPDLEYGGYTAEVAGLPGCVTQGETLDELREMAADAIQAWLLAREELAGEGVPVPGVTCRSGHKKKLRHKSA